MATIYLCGHGGWSRAEGGAAFVIVPRDTTVTFYSEAGTTISDLQTIAIMSGDINALRPVSVYGPYRSLPNLSLYPGTFVNERVAALEAGVRIEMVNRKTCLRELLDEFAGNDLHWLACRVHGLRRN